MQEMNQPTPAPLALSAKARRTCEAPISALVAAALADPELISFAAGLVDPAMLPAGQTALAAARVLGDPARAQAALQYGTTLGLRPLRHELLRHIERLEGRPAGELGLTADDMIITTGSQQALYLVADVLLDPGDIVIAANPSYFVFTGTLQSLGADVQAVPADDEGMDVDAAERLLESIEADGRLGRVRFIYTTSFFDNPTGLTLSLARRRRLLEIVRRFSRSHRILILEDAAYRELRYDGEALPSIKSFDPDNRFTILTQTFSKAFAPGIKLGYTLMPRDLMEAVLRQKGNHDFGSSSLCQHLALEALAGGGYERHLETIRAHYQRKRDLMLAALEKHMPRAPGLRWTSPHGGLYVWVTLPPAIDSSSEGSLWRASLQRGVLYVPGDYSFHPDATGAVPRNHLRLCFGPVAMERIDEGIARLCAAVREHLQAGPVRQTRELSA
jgi:2-aminoadipate transaminase